MGYNSRTSHQSYVVAPTASAPPADPVEVPHDAADSGTPGAEQLDLLHAEAITPTRNESPPQRPPDPTVGLARCPHCGQFVGLADHDCPIWVARNRDYRSEHGRISCRPIGLLQEHLALGEDPVMVRLEGDMRGHGVHGQVPVYGPEVPFDPAAATEHLQCSCGQPNCFHAQMVAAEFIDRLRSRRIRTPDRRATAAVLDQHREPARCPDCGQFVGLADHDCPIRLAGRRDYRSEHGRITCQPIELLQEHLALGDDPVMVWLDGRIDGHFVQGEVPVYGPNVPFDPAAATEHLQCNCRQPNCSHAQLVAAEFVDRLRTPRGRATPDRRATAAVLDELAAEHRDSVAAQQTAASSQPANEVSYVDDPQAFQAAYTAARDRVSNAQPPVPYQMDNATGGLGARDGGRGGRGFGVELEFDLPPHNREATLAAIAEDLHRAGVSRHRSMVGYHAGRSNGYSDARDAWRLERDSTVSGEIVSPILYDTPQTWRDLAAVCDIVGRHGGTASARAGSHVHVSAHNYDHTVENHNRLVRLVDRYSDTLFRLAANPSRGRHRGTNWCSPGSVPAAGYRTVEAARVNNGGHHRALNMQALHGRSSDHVEFRMWDASLEPAVIQSQIKVSLGLTEAAFRDARSTNPVNDGRVDRLGSHRRTYGTGRLRGEPWRESTRSFRSLMDTIFHRRSDKEQLTGLFAITRWQQ